MTILIKGMEIPQGCYDCPLQHRGFNGSETVHYCYVAAKEVSDDGETDTDCPLTEVPTPHERLIDARVLQHDMMDMVQSDLYGLEDMIDAVIEAPTVIEAEEG